MTWFAVKCCFKFHLNIKNRYVYYAQIIERFIFFITANLHKKKKQITLYLTCFDLDVWIISNECVTVKKSFSHCEGVCVYVLPLSLISIAVLRVLFPLYLKVQCILCKPNVVAETKNEKVVNISSMFIVVILNAQPDACHVN